MPNKLWVYVKTPIKFTDITKISLKSRIAAVLKEVPAVEAEISRMALRGGRIYFYQLVEPFKLEGFEDTDDSGVELIEDKYLEFPYARITVYDNNANKCSLDWERYNRQWFSVFDGTLEDCIRTIDVMPHFIKYK